ncbi:phosphodiester glycosidase family protein [Streptomyces sp. NPDC053792]|uniref:phosphodiester glycosidase family protein n=1 Tax=Streptomyces sp. NPDC053792 TaxID=3365716 RepID=UPI0037D41A60
MPVTRNLRPLAALAAAAVALTLTTSAAASPTVEEPPSPLGAGWTKQLPVATLATGVTYTTWKETTPDNRTKGRVLRVVEIDPTAGALTLENTFGKGSGVTENVYDQLDTVSSVDTRDPYAGINGSLFKSEAKHRDHILPADAEARTMMYQGVSVTDGVPHSSSCWGNGLGTNGAVIQYGIPYITKLRTDMSLTTSTGATIRLDDVNRDPGRAWGCGRDAEDKAVTEVTGLYADPDEIVLFTDDYQYPVPKPNLDTHAYFTADDDPGFEVVLDANGSVVDAHEGRGGALATDQVKVPAGGRILQGIGTGAKWLRDNLVRDDRVTVDQKLTDTRLGREIPLDDSVDVVSSYHQLLQSGEVPPALPDSCTDGKVPGTDPAVLNCTDSRTALGTNVRGNPVLITLTGDTGIEDGDYLRRFATLLDSKELGLVDVLNLDGGGSTTLLTGKTVQTPPTDTVGGVKVFRHVADAVYTGVGGYGMYAK